MSAKADMHYIGTGTASCGSWSASRRVDSIQWRADAQWVLGFLSGVGSTKGLTQMDPLNNVDALGVWAWIDNYCGRNPIDDLRSASVAFVVAHPGN